MATITPTFIRRGQGMERETIAIYSNMAAGDAGAWMSEPGLVFKAISVYGTLGIGGSVQITTTMFGATGQTPIVGVQADETDIMTAISAIGVMPITGVRGASFRVAAVAGASALLTVRFLFQPAGA